MHTGTLSELFDKNLTVHNHLHNTNSKKMMLTVSIMHMHGFTILIGYGLGPFVCSEQSQTII